MARPLRIEYPGALYHVVSRGNAYQDIYLDNKDRKNFLKNLEHCLELHNVICHAYCLMGNHYHLLLETPDGNLSKAMRDVNGNYTQGFNLRHNRVGHVLQGRYKAFVIEKEFYLMEVARYIINNPVEANLVDHPRNWYWSSYRATSGAVKTPGWLTINWMLSFFSENRKEAQKQYRQFVRKGIGEDSPYKDLNEGVILGSPQFVHWIWEKTRGSETIKEIPRDQRIVGRPTLEEIFEDVVDIKSRNAAIIFARKRCGYLTTEIASYVELDRSVVGKISLGTYNIKSKPITRPDPN